MTLAMELRRCVSVVPPTMTENNHVVRFIRNGQEAILTVDGLRVANAHDGKSYLLTEIMISLYLQNF